MSETSHGLSHQGFLDSLAHFADDILKQNANASIFASCGQLMAESLLNNGKILSMGFDLTDHISQQLTTMLTANPDKPRPALPAVSFQASNMGIAKLRSVAREEDFMVVFGCQDDLQRRDQVIEQCTQTNCTSVLFTPDLDGVHSNDKTLEIRLEYNSQATYQTSLSAICGYLVQTIEYHLFEDNH